MSQEVSKLKLDLERANRWTHSLRIIHNLGQRTHNEKTGLGFYKSSTAINDLCYALDKFADLYDLAPGGLWEIKYDFGDITYSYQEDKATWWNYVVQGKMPAWKYFEKFEGMTKDEAIELLTEAVQSNAETQQLFAQVGNEG